jgi:tetratricopeptide (TPR) repeat protein
LSERKFRCKGKPPFVYRRWLSLSDSGIIFGIRQVSWAAIDGLALNFFGNLLIQSRAICGPNSLHPDVVLAIPFGLAAPEAQKAFIDQAQRKNEKLLLNRRLIKRMGSREPKFAPAVSLIGPVIMLLVLLDLGNSTCAYLEMVKNYYLAQSQARAGNLSQAREHLVKADWQLAHPQMLSLVNIKLLREGSIAAGVHQARAEALWYMGLKAEAVKEARQVTTLAPKQYRNWLFLARLLADTGKEKQARACVDMAVDLHDEALLPRLYVLALLAQDKHSARDYYQISLADLKEKVFGDEPNWPPGGNRFLGDLFFTDDIRFVYDRLIAPPVPVNPPLGAPN